MSESNLDFDEVPRGAGGTGAAEAINQVLHDAGVDAPASLYDEALSLAQEGHLAPAADRLRMLLVLDPADADANLLLGKVYASLARWQDALGALDAARQAGAVLPPGLRDDVADALRRDVESAEAERQRLQARERGEVRSLRSEAKKLRTENAVLEQRMLELDKRVRLWSGATAVVAGCASAVLLAAMLFGGSPQTAAEMDAGAAEAVAEVEASPGVEPTPEAEEAVAVAAVAAEAVEAVPVEDVVSPPDAAAAPTPAPTPAPAVEVLTTHTVKSGDNLNDISSKYYGKSTEWKKILVANEALLHGDHSKLRPGQTLTIPK